MANRRGKSGSSDRLVCIVKATVFLVVMVFLVGMWEVDHKEGWALKNSWFQTVVLEKALESPLDCKEFKPVNPKANQAWIFIGELLLKLQYFGHLMWRLNSLWCWEGLQQSQCFHSSLNKPCPFIFPGLFLLFLVLWDILNVISFLKPPHTAKR